MGGKVHTGTMVLRGLGTALKERGNQSYEQIVADTLRIFGQGTKVVVEIVAMSADAGSGRFIIPYFYCTPDPVISNPKATACLRNLF